MEMKFTSANFDKEVWNPRYLFWLIFLLHGAALAR